MNLTQFTKLNDGIKAIRFKAVPVLCTRENLTKNNVLDYDLSLQDKVNTLAIAMDDMFSIILDSAVSNITCLTLESVEEASLNSSNEQALADRVAEQLSKSISLTFNAKTITVDFAKWLETSEIPNKDELKDILKTKGIYTIMTGYMTSRKFIMTGAKRGAAANRLVENALIWYQNKKSVQNLTDMQLAAVAPNPDDKNALTKNVSDYMTTEGIKNYNRIISGYSDGTTCIKGFNQLVSEWNQQINDKRPIRQLKKMNKMLLAEQTTQFNVARFESEHELFTSLSAFVNRSENGIERAIEKLSHLTDNVYMGFRAVDILSNELLGKRMYLRNLIKEEIMEQAGKTPKEADKLFKKEVYSVEYVNHLLQRSNEVISLQKHYKGKMKKISIHVQATQEALKSKVLEKGCLNIDTDVNFIKDYLDALLDVCREMKLFNVDTSGKQFDLQFYGNWEDVIKDLNNCNQMYNMVRNFVTKKPVDLTKEFMSCLGDARKLTGNFLQSDNSMLKSSEQALLRKNGEYFYLAFAKGSRVSVKTDIQPDGNCYEKLYIKKIAKGGMVLPRWMYMTKGEKADEMFEDKSIMEYQRVKNMIHPITITRQMWENKESGKWAANYVDEKMLSKLPADEKNRRIKEHEDSLQQLIDAYKLFIGNYMETSYYDYHFKKTSDYRTIKDFTDDFEQQSYAARIVYIKTSELENLIKSGDAYLFRLENQAIRKGHFRDSHALYLRELFSQNSTIKLNSNPSVRYRKPHIKYHVTHEKGSILVGKTTKTDEHIPLEIYKDLCLYKNKKLSKLSPQAAAYLPVIRCKEAIYPVIKDRRYTEEQFTLTFSITYNRDVVHKDRITNTINYIAREQILKDGGSNIVAIVRGERNLLYMTVIDKNGSVLLSKSLNQVCGIDYQQKLKSLDAERKSQQWGISKQVATIKNGYLSFAVTEILTAMKKYNAVLAIEAINDKFKDTRSCVDNQVYKKFETMLVQRMNCYFTLDADNEGSFHNPYQLASTENNFLQNGLLFNIDPSYTSNICPQSGFVNVFDYSVITGIKKERDFLSKLDKIEYKDGVFEFSFDYNNFVCRKKVPITKWVVSTKVSSYPYNRGKRNYDEVSPTQIMSDVCNREKIIFTKGGDILPSLLEYAADSSVDEIYNAFRICTRMQYTTLENNKLIDCYKSPVVCSHVPSFMPIEKDEAKAYNVALKCQLNINHIIKGESIGVKSEEWFSYKMQ